MNDERRLGLKEAARYLGVAPITLRREIKRSNIDFYRIGQKRIIFSIPQLNAYMARREQKAQAA